MSVMMDPIDHVRIVGEPFKVTCRITAPSHKYDVRWETAAKNVSCGASRGNRAFLETGRCKNYPDPSQLPSQSSYSSKL